MLTGWVDVGSDDDEGRPLPRDLSEVGVVVVAKVMNWFAGDVVVAEPALWVASKSQRAIVTFVPVVVR